MKGKPRLPKRIFLSHATRDRRHASRIAKVLREHGIPVWYSRIHLGGAQQWQQEIGKALRQCDWFLVLLSPSAVKSMWVKRELSYALIQKRYENKIIPLVLHDCDHESLHWTLATFQMIDFTKGFASGWTELIRIWAVPSVVRTRYSKSASAAADDEPASHAIMFLCLNAAKVSSELR